MMNNKYFVKENFEYTCLILVILFLLINAAIKQDSIYALISASCGITYTFLAGKGKPICYLFGITGSGFYSLLSFQNLIWGNVFLYLCYYIPMQIIGYFKWNKNLQKEKKEIVKTYLSKKELSVILLISFVLICGLYLFFIQIKDAHPLLDSMTTVFSLGGMYLTVRRAIEQWIFWGIVNLLSLIMWISIALDGPRVYSTIIMWAVYLVLAIYFYIDWRREIKKNM